MAATLLRKGGLSHESRNSRMKGLFVRGTAIVLAVLMAATVFSALVFR